MLRLLSHRRTLLLLATLISLLGGLYLLATLDPLTNDDAFVYYNYARNFVAGRPFAYDVRNIPSEGFTSLLYLLLLVPFEALHINMTFISALINLLALALTALLTAWLAVRSALLTPSQGIGFGVLLWVLLTLDPNIRTTINWGLESLLGPLILVLAAAALWAACTPEDERRARRGLTAFYALLFLAYITRPESMAFIALVGGLLLLTAPIPRRRVLHGAIGFALVFAAYHGFKLLLYGDLLPTGFYRKVGGSGLVYVLEWTLAYLPLLLPLAALLVIHWRRGGALWRARWTRLVGGVSLLTLAFFLVTAPLVGNGFRFLMTPTVMLYILLLLAAVSLAGEMHTRWRLSPALPAALLLVLAAGLAGLCWNASGGRLDALNIYARAVRATESHAYLKLGEWLNHALPDPQAVTLVFGDAGALPYALDSRFIDSNGLTEPTIAHLFRLPDGDEKTQQYVSYILAQQPDLVVLAYGEVNAADGSWELPVNSHSPFKGHLPLELYNAYRDSGIVYACSVHAYYDLHMGIRTGTPRSSALATALRDYCARDGYTLANGLTVRSPEGGSVAFPVAAAG